MEQKKTGTGLVFIGIVAILALILGWTAFNRSGQDVLPTIAEESQEAAAEVEAAVEVTAEEVELAAARAEAQAELMTLEARLEAEENYEEAAAEVRAINDELEAAYANASIEARQEYYEVQQKLSTLEQDLRDGTGNVLEVIGGAILLLEADVRTDEDDVEGEANVYMNS